MPWSPDDDSAGPRKVLVFESDAEGHSLEWLEHLIVFAAARPDIELVLAVPEPLRAPLERAVPLTALGRISVTALTERERKLCTMRSLTLASCKTSTEPSPCSRTNTSSRMRKADSRSWSFVIFFTVIICYVPAWGSYGVL